MPRCSLCFERDEPVRSKEIEDHAAVLRSLGTRVKAVSFKTSGLVHMDDIVQRNTNQQSSTMTRSVDLDKTKRVVDLDIYHHTGSIAANH